MKCELFQLSEINPTDDFLLIKVGKDMGDTNEQITDLEELRIEYLQLSLCASLNYAGIDTGEYLPSENVMRNSIIIEEFINLIKSL